MSDRLGIEFISTLGVPPPEHVAVARGLGCGRVGLGPVPIVALPGAAAWSLRDDAALLLETKAALREHEVTVSLGEGFMVVPGRDIADARADLDLMAELGAATVNVLAFEPDGARVVDQLAQFAAMAAERGMAAVLEFLPIGPIDSLVAALRVTEQVGGDLAVLVDLMHLARSGGTADDLAAVPPGRIGYVQLCDVPLVAAHDDYGEEARHDRLPPGEGELPLADLLAVCPRDVTVGLEVPRRAAALRGIGPHDLLAGSVAAARALLRATG